MSEEREIDESPRPESPDRTENPLRAALNRARQQEVERSDVIVDLREAELARLELLQDALHDVFEAIPDDNDLLECALIPSTPPRLWVDVLGHVVMGRDKRTYRFVKDTRHGRQVILETTSLEEMASRVTDYVAHRLLERQRALESDAGGRSLAARPEKTPHPVDHGTPDADPAAEPRGTGEGPARRMPASRSGRGWVAFLAFVIGVLVGAAGLVAAGLILTAP